MTKRSFCALEMMARSCLCAPKNRAYCSTKHQKQKVILGDQPAQWFARFEGVTLGPTKAFGHPKKGRLIKY